MLPKSTSVVSLVPIKNMDRAIRFYTKALGATVNMRGTGSMKDGWASISVGRTELWLVKPAENINRKLSYHSFVVKNIKSAVKELKKNSVVRLPAEPMGPKDRAEGPINYTQYGASAFFKDSEGNLMMLWQTMM